MNEVEKKLGINFKDKDLLSRALTHRSLKAEGMGGNYERLEFLGDAVLGLAVAQLLLDMHPNATEGELSKMRAALVNASTLSEIAKNLELGSQIRVSKGEKTAGAQERVSTLSDVMESIIGAIYKDAGFEKALSVVESLYGSRIKSVSPRDPKTELQEYLQAKKMNPPEYVLEATDGPEHAPTFITAVVVDGEILGKGSGPTKKLSQQIAAAEALYKLSGEK